MTARKQELADKIMARIFTDGGELYFNADSEEDIECGHLTPLDDPITDADLVSWF